MEGSSIVEDKPRHATITSDLQDDCEEECIVFLKEFSTMHESHLAALQNHGLINKDLEVCLLRKKHVAYFMTAINKEAYQAYDASRAWLLFWSMSSLAILGENLPNEIFQRLVNTVRLFQNSKTGGFGGGPMQLSHSAPTYACVFALVAAAGMISSSSSSLTSSIPSLPSSLSMDIGVAAVLNTIDRKALYRYLLARKIPGGGFYVHDDGEIDMRGTYTAVAVASVTNMLTPELRDSVTEFIVSCQTVEGGFGGEPGNESHGGYTFCAFASLIILGTADRCDVDALEQWVASCQMSFEGGYQGRTNKLVDGCYSYWQGAIPALIALYRLGARGLTSSSSSSSSLSTSSSMGFRTKIDANIRCSTKTLRAIDVATTTTTTTSDSASTGSAIHVLPSVLLPTPTPSCSDSVEGSGTAVSLNGAKLQKYILHCCQEINGGLRDKPSKGRDFYHSCYCLSGLSVAQHYSRDGVFGDAEVNTLMKIDPIYNVRLDAMATAVSYFGACESTHAYLTSP